MGKTSPRIILVRLCPAAVLRCMPQHREGVPRTLPCQLSLLALNRPLNSTAPKHGRKSGVHESGWTPCSSLPPPCADARPRASPSPVTLWCCWCATRRDGGGCLALYEHISKPGLPFGRHKTQASCACLQHTVSAPGHKAVPITLGDCPSAFCSLPACSLY